MINSCNHNDSHEHNHQEYEHAQINNDIKSLSIGSSAILQTFVNKISNDHLKSASNKRDSFRRTKMFSSDRDTIESIENEDILPQISCSQM